MLGKDTHYVDGAWLSAIKIAQQYWVPNKEWVPLKSWKGCDIPEELIEVGLAELSKDGTKIYLSGSEEHFAWWFKRQAAGKKGGLAKASKAKQCVPSSSSKRNSSLSLESQRSNSILNSTPPKEKLSSSSSPSSRNHDDEDTLKYQRTLKSGLERICNGDVGQPLLKLIPKMAEHFKNYESFKEWANEVMDTKAVKKHLQDGNYSKIRNYFFVSLRNELGL